MTADKHIHSLDHPDYHPMLHSSQNEPIYPIESFEDMGDHIKLKLTRNGETVVRDYEKGSHWVISEEGKDDRYFGTDINLSIYEPPIVIDMGIDMPSFERAINYTASGLAHALECSIDDIKYKHTDDDGTRCFSIMGSSEVYSSSEIMNMPEDELEEFKTQVFKL